MSASSLIIYAEKNDPLVASLNDSNLDPALHHVIHVDELLEYMTRSKWPEVLNISLPGVIESKFSVDLIVNRLFTLLGTRTSEQLNEWDISERWFHIRMAPYLKHGARLVHDCGVRGVSNCLLPLNTQWYHVDRLCPSVSTPLFSYASGSEEPELAIFKDPMQKSIWSIFDWKKEHNISPSELRRHKFMVERPVGTPVIFYYLGSMFSDFIYPNRSASINCVALKELSDLCRHKFHSEAGEVLCYVENNGKVRFYGFSPFLNSAASGPGFGEHAAKWLQFNHAF